MAGTVPCEADETCDETSDICIVECYTPGVAFTRTINVDASRRHVRLRRRRRPAGRLERPRAYRAGGEWDAVSGKVKWYFLDGSPRVLTYAATPPASATGSQCFAATASFDGGPSQSIDERCVQPCEPSPCYVPGVPLTRTVSVSPVSGTVVYGVEDTPPSGWTISAVSDNGTWDSVNRKVKWYFLDGSAEHIDICGNRAGKRHRDPVLHRDRQLQRRREPDDRHELSSALRWLCALGPRGYGYCSTRKAETRMKATTATIRNSRG